MFKHTSDIVFKNKGSVKIVKRYNYNKNKFKLDHIFCSTL